MSNITNLNRDYLIKINVKEATIDVPKMTFWNTDKKTSNMFVQLVINMSTNELISQYVTVQNATDYKITLNVIKPKTNQYRTIEATLLNEEKALFEIDLPDEFTDQVGDYSFEFEVSSKVDSNDESITTSNGTYKVNGSILTNLNQEISPSPDLPILKQLIEQVKSLQGGDLTGYQKKSDNSLETTSKEVVGAINEVNSQFKDIANNQPTDLSLDSATNLLQLVNSKGSKLGNGITLPISSGGGTSQYLHIKYSSTGAPQLAGQMSDTPNAYIGLCVDTNADAPTNPRSYTWYQWKGDNGAKGDTGATPNLQIGTVTTLDSGSNATASITGTTENPLLNLGIPKGDTGSGTDNGGSSEEKGWRLINEFTLTENANAMEISKDKNSNSFNVKELFYYVKGKSLGVSGNVGVFINGTLIFYDSGLTNINSSVELTTVGKLEIYENILGYSLKKGFDAMMISQVFTGVKEGFTGITKFKIASTNNIEIGWQAGTVLKIYGK
jgi:hypothetical protein